MQQTHTYVYKNPKTNWRDYQYYEAEPKVPSRYDLSPDMEEALFDHVIFLKRRIWNNMAKVRYESIGDISESKHKEWKIFKPNHLRHSFGRP